MPTIPTPGTDADAAADDLALVRRMRQAVAALPDVPPALEQRALALFPAPLRGALPALQQTAGSLLRQLAALLSFDSWATSSLALGMRSLRSPTRHLLFSAEGRDIDLRIAPTAQAFALAGQILGPDEAGRVHLQRLDEGGNAAAGAAAQTGTLDALGEFHLEGLVAGRYRLTLQLGGDEITLPPLDVGEPPP